MQASAESRERERRFKKIAYDYCKAKGICVICQREEAFYRHVRCPACMEKAAEQKARRTADMTPEQRAYQNQLKRERYHRNKAAGLCVNCGKKAQDGKTMCATCVIQQRRAGAAYRLRSGKKKGWAEAGLCIRCGAEPISGRKLCPDCLERNQAAMAYARQFAPKDRPWERRDDLWSG